MVAVLRPMPAEALAAWLAYSNAEYVRERMAAGDSAEYANERAAESNAQYFPDGRPAAGQLVFQVLDDGTTATTAAGAGGDRGADDAAGAGAADTDAAGANAATAGAIDGDAVASAAAAAAAAAEARVVGVLWIGPMSARHPDDWWVFDVEIDEAYRGRGLGRAAMLLAEQAARAHGATRLGLNVFGHNAVAQRLYTSLGYEPTAINMAKPL